jgi:hypothetical protein
MNTFKPRLVSVIFTLSVRTAKKTEHFTTTKINRLTLFKEIIAVYSENHTNQIKARTQMSSGLLHYVVREKFIDVSEALAASIVRASSS